MVADARGRLIDGAEVEIWQCDVMAHYRHPQVPRQPGGFDPGFQGLGLARSDAAVTQALNGGKIKSLAAGRMGLGIKEVGDLVASLV